MTNEIALWVLGAILVPLIGWCTFTTTLLLGIKRDSGSVSRELVTAIRSLSHYVEWLCEHTTGKKPPPPPVKIS